MMYKKRVIYLMVCVFFIVNTNCKVKGIDNIPKEKVLIVHDNFNSFLYDNNIIYSVRELLGAFNAKVKIIDLDNYKEKEIYNYDYVFVIAVDEEVNKKCFFIEDLKKYNKKICWIGKGIDIFLQNNPKYKMKYIGTKRDITETYYSNKKSMNISNMEKFYLESNKYFTILNPYSTDTKIYAYLSNGQDYFPYIINEKNLWHISEIDNNSIIFYIFSDVLNDIFEVNKFEKEKVFIRIEDMNPLIDIDKLKSIADFLYSEDIPFIISLVPIVMDSKTGYTTGISDKKEFIETIKYMQKKGGSIILYGYINQNSKKEKIKESYKFKNQKVSNSLNFDMQKYVYDKVGKNLDECVKNHIYPLGFGATHYDMDIREYKELKKYFSTYVGQYQNNNKFIFNAYPYILKDTEIFNIFIPENLGNIENNSSLWLREIQENFRRISIVRGYTAGVFFNPNMDINYLKNLVDYFKSQNVNFLDLKEEENWVKWNDIKVSSKDGIFNVKYKETEEFNKKNFKKKQLIDRVNFIIIIIVTVFVTIFFLSKKKDRNKFLR